MDSKKKENGGYLFTNSNKSTDKQPDWRGKLNIGGKEYLISGWNRSQDGSNMISLSATDPATLPPKGQGQQGGQGGYAGAKSQGGSTPFSKERQAEPPKPSSRAPEPTPSDYPDLDELEDLFGED